MINNETKPFVLAEEINGLKNIFTDSQESLLQATICWAILVTLFGSLNIFWIAALVIILTTGFSIYFRVEKEQKKMIVLLEELQEMQLEIDSDDTIS